MIPETNLTGTYLCSNAVAAHMVARGTPARISPADTDRLDRGPVAPGGE